MNSFLTTVKYPSMFNKFIGIKQQINKKQVFIKINEINLLNNSNNKNVNAFIGSRKAFKAGISTIESDLSKTWSFTYSNKERSSFVLALYDQKSIFGTSKLLGEIEIKLSSFKSNSVTKNTFLLRSLDRNSEPILVTLLLHLNENNSKAFQAPESNILNYEYEIIPTHLNFETENLIV